MAIGIYKFTIVHFEFPAYRPPPKKKKSNTSSIRCLFNHSSTRKYVTTSYHNKYIVKNQVATIEAINN